MKQQDELLWGELQDAIEGQTCNDCEYCMADIVAIKRYYCRLFKSKKSTNGYKLVSKTKPACLMFEKIIKKKKGNE